MKVLHINTKYKGGGAARAMKRFHQQLVAKGHASRFLVGRPQQADPPLVEFVGNSVSIYRTKLDRLMSRYGNCFENLWGIHPWARRPTLNLPQTEIYQWADIIDMRNLFGNYFNLWVLPELTLGKPVVWRLPDMWALTGHCAYPYHCQRWRTGCHDCPLLTEEGRKIVEPPPTKWDGTRRVWHAKRGIYADSKLHVVVNSQWMKENVKNSILGNALSINIISNGVDLNEYKPYSNKVVRKEFDLPQNRNILLFSAADLGNRRKGYTQAVKAVKILQERMVPPPMLITMGSTKGVKSEDAPSFVRHFGFVKDVSRQARLYAAADLFLCTTLADAQPQTALESIACGTPIIAFDIGPMSDIVGKGSHGLIADEIHPESLADTIEKAFSKPRRLVEMGQTCRKKAERDYNLDAQTDQYIALYQDILSSS